MTPSKLDEDGYLLLSGAVDALARDRLLQLIALDAWDDAARTSAGNPFGARALLQKIPTLASTLHLCGVDAIAATLLGCGVRAIDALFFDKHAEAKWTVPGHQDRVFVAKATPGPRTRIRSGIAFEEPEAATVAALLALRIHFDPLDENGGALCFVPGSHRTVLNAEAIKQTPLSRYRPCAAGAGDIIAMRPLVLHRSSPSTSSGHRRVLHVVYERAAD